MGRMFMTLFSTHLRQRLQVGAIALIITFFSIYYSLSPYFYPIFTILCALLTALSLTEYFELAKRKGFSPFSKWGICASTLYLIALSLDTTFSSSWALWTLLIIFVSTFFLAFFYNDSSLPNLAITLFGISYLTIPLGFILQINGFFLLSGLEDGRIWLIYAVLISKITDIGGYFFGKAFGHKKLAPIISPKKTIIGSVGGSLTAVLTSFLFATIIPFYAAFEMSIWQSLYLGLVISILAQLGDLAESLLKRDAGAKDSSDIPGLGGFLDMVDSLVFTLPFVYLWLLSQSTAIR